MFSVVKFIAAAAIVALFGGFLLTGVLTTQQGDEMAPAAVTESPSPMTSEELLSGMVTEEVEPGVFRVANDGVRYLSYPGGIDPSHSVDVTPDGSVWLSGIDAMYRLGDEVTYREPDHWGPYPYKEVGPDGTLWAIDEWSSVQSFDGQTWTERSERTGDDLYLAALAIGPDGTVWVAAGDRDKHCPDIESDVCSGTVLLRLEDDGSLTTIEDWLDVFDGDARMHDVAVAPDGDVWFVGTDDRRQRKAKALLRFDGEGWEAIPRPEGWEAGGPSFRHFGFGLDGALWVNASYHDEEEGRTVGGLARFDDPGWTTYTEADGVEPWGGQGGMVSTDLLNVAVDGTFWLNGRPTPGGEGGVAHYDGTTWTPYLPDSYIHDLTIAPDGSVWVRAYYARAYGFTGPVGLYVITPEAVAATE